MEVKFCSKCNSQWYTDEKVCPNCGNTEVKVKKDDV